MTKLIALLACHGELWLFLRTTAMNLRTACHRRNNKRITCGADSFILHNFTLAINLRIPPDYLSYRMPGITTATILPHDVCRRWKPLRWQLARRVRAASSAPSVDLGSAGMVHRRASSCVLFVRGGLFGSVFWRSSMSWSLFSRPPLLLTRLRPPRR